MPECASYAVSHAQGTLTSIEYRIDANRNITGISSGTNDPDGKIAKENAERKAKEKKAQEEKAAKRRAEKKAEEEARTETGEYTVSATGTGIKAVTQKVIDASLGASAPTAASFDINA